MSVAEAARILGVTPQTVYNKLRSGELHASEELSAPNSRIRLSAESVYLLAAKRSRERGLGDDAFTVSAPLAAGVDHFTSAAELPQDFVAVNDPLADLLRDALRREALAVERAGIFDRLLSEARDRTATLEAVIELRAVSDEERARAMEHAVGAQEALMKAWAAERAAADQLLHAVPVRP